MLQRIQTIYFLVATILIALPLFGVSIFSFKLGNLNQYVTVFGSIEKDQAVKIVYDFYYGVLVALLTCVASIFIYKNRITQMRIAWISLFLTLVTTVWMWLGVKSTMPMAAKVACGDCVASAQMPTIFYILFASASVFIFLGIRSVKKDQDLIDSLNRLR
jgi:hypothetical protein